MADPYVRQVGEVADLDGRRVPVGVDYDAVRVGDARFFSGQVAEVAHLLLVACWEAGQNSRRMSEEMT